MRITIEWLKEKRSCSEGIVWFENQKLSESVDVLKSLIKEDKLDWANWTIVRVMERIQYLQCAVFAAEQVLGIFEKKYPTDDRPRKAIDSARKCLENNSEENRGAAYVAANAAADVAYAAADAAAHAAAYAADAAAHAAYWAAYAAADVAYAAAYVATYASDAAANAAYAAYVSDAAGQVAKKQMQIKILTYGIGVLDRLAQEEQRHSQIDS